MQNQVEVHAVTSRLGRLVSGITRRSFEIRAQCPTCETQVFAVLDKPAGEWYCPYCHCTLDEVQGQ